MTSTKHRPAIGEYRWEVDYQKLGPSRSHPETDAALKRTRHPRIEGTAPGIN
jgi:hypothetical protein